MSETSQYSLKLRHDRCRAGTRERSLSGRFREQARSRNGSGYIREMRGKTASTPLVGLSRCSPTAAISELGSSILMVNIFSGNQVLAGIDQLSEGDQLMSDPYIEDNGDEYPINSCIGCGQTPYKVDFEGAAIDDSSAKNKSGVTPGIGKAKFLPKISNRRKNS